MIEIEKWHGSPYQISLTFCWQREKVQTMF